MNRSASARQWRSLPIFSGSKLVYTRTENGMILPESQKPLRRLCLDTAGGTDTYPRCGKKPGVNETSAGKKSLGHFGEAVAEGVDDEFEPVGDFEF